MRLLFLAGLARARRLAEHKLLAELHRSFAPPVVVAVAGGTNVGKSTMFNAILEDEVSSVDARAGHTVCPVVAGGTDAADLTTVLLPDYRTVHGTKVAGNIADAGSLYLAEVSTPGGAANPCDRPSQRRDAWPRPWRCLYP